MLAALAVAAPSLVLGQGSSAALDAAFSEWLDQENTTGVLGVGTRLNDGSWQIATYGPAATAPRELASVSKSVTAICVQHLVEAGDLRWSDQLDTVLPDGPPVSVADLVTHSGGLAPDATQVAMPLWLDQTVPPQTHFSEQVLDLVTGRTDQPGVRGEYTYNNENYALLGLIIEAVTEQPYFEACASRLDLPEGIRPSSRTSVFQPWGGLVAEPAAYLEFLHTHFGPDSAVADDPLAFPHVYIGDGAYYGLGMVFRQFGDGFNFWHFGAHCFPGRLEAGSYAVLWEGRMSAIALYDACVEWGAMAALDRTLSAAAYGRTP